MRSLALLIFCLVGSSAYAELEVAQLFSDHMVLQRDMKVPVWGWAEPGEDVTVAIDRQTRTAEANDAGKWMVALDPMPVGQPRTMTVKGKAETKQFTDILLGEVWICSGQSNMEWQLSKCRNAEKEIATADVPNLRLFKVNVPGNNLPLGGPLERLVDGKGKPTDHVWQVCTPKSAGGLSGVAYYFGRDLQAAQNVPVGLITCAVGGSSVEQWTSREGFMADPDYKACLDYFDRRAAFAATPEGQAQVKLNYDGHEARQAELKKQGKPALWPPHYRAPVRDDVTSLWYNSRIHPLLPFAIRGVVWYQGETHRNRPYDTQGLYPRDYRDSFPLMIKDWRARWTSASPGDPGQGDFPFVIVQLPNSSEPETPVFSGWSLVREAHLKALALPKTSLVVAIDTADPPGLHPVDKEVIGQRVAIAARGAVYGEKIVYSGPIYTGMKVNGSTIRVSFSHVGGGLQAKGGGDLKWFTIAGADGKFVPASARIDGETVIVQSESVPQPASVRYAWHNNPAGCNLYNKEGLPASPFRTDDDPPRERAAWYKELLAQPVSLRSTR